MEIPIVKRARAMAVDGYSQDSDLLHDMSDLIEELSAALEPFAAMTFSDKFIDDRETPNDAICSSMSYRAGDYRRARAALARAKRAYAISDGEA